MNLEENINQALDLLAASGVIFDDGLTDAEVSRIQEQFGFQFPPDLMAFLQAALPVTLIGGREETFPNWRSGEIENLQTRLDWPFDGMVFDIENNVFWLDDWGARPASLEAAIEVARRAVDSAPKLIPVYSHRYLPAEPFLAGNPVLSVHQTDIIYYGADLWDYFRNEFGPKQERRQKLTVKPGEAIGQIVRPIRFWSTIMDG